MLDRFRRRLEVLRNQPVARHQSIKVMLRFANAEIINAWLGYPFIASHEFGALLIVEKGHHATRSHYFFGLQDFVDELFAIHFLREDELFIDIGANLRNLLDHGRGSNARSRYRRRALTKLVAGLQTTYCVEWSDGPHHCN